MAHEQTPPGERSTGCLTLILVAIVVLVFMAAAAWLLGDFAR